MDRPAAALNQARTLIDHGLSYHLGLHARELCQDALWLLDQDRQDEAVDALCEALALCSDPLAGHHLQAARDLLDPGRISSA